MHVLEGLHELACRLISIVISTLYSVLYYPMAKYQLEWYPAAVHPPCIAHENIEVRNPPHHTFDNAEECNRWIKEALILSELLTYCDILTSLPHFIPSLHILIINISYSEIGSERVKVTGSPRS